MKRKREAGIIGIFIIVPIIFLAAAGTFGAVKLQQFDNKIKSTQKQVDTNNLKLSEIKKSYKDYDEKIKMSKGRGIETKEFEDKRQEIARLLRQSDFDTAKGQIASFDASLDQALSAKKEADRKITIELRDKVEAKLTDYKKKGVDISLSEKNIPEIRTFIDKEEFGKARDKISETDKLLDQKLAEKQAADRKAEEAKKAAQAAAAAAKTVQSQSAKINPATSYERKTVTNQRGSFSIDVVIVDLNSAKIVTDTANSDDCSDNCPAKPLASYVSENGGFAGMNGTYFCPPDYSSCAGKVNSFDFPVYNSRLGKLINASKLFWSGRAMIAFDGGNNPYFFKDANSFGGVSVSAAIVNYPALLSAGQIVINESALPSNLNSKGTRGAMGFSGKTLYLVVGRGASVVDMAYVMQSLGATNAMNMDGGGSTALYYGGYKVGPGRSLPNAVVIK